MHEPQNPRESTPASQTNSIKVSAPDVIRQQTDPFLTLSSALSKSGIPLVERFTAGLLSIVALNGYCTDSHYSLYTNSRWDWVSDDLFVDTLQATARYLRDHPELAKDAAAMLLNVIGPSLTNYVSGNVLNVIAPPLMGLKRHANKGISVGSRLGVEMDLPYPSSGSVYIPGAGLSNILELTKMRSYSSQHFTLVDKNEFVVHALNLAAEYLNVPNVTAICADMATYTPNRPNGGTTLIVAVERAGRSAVQDLIRQTAATMVIGDAITILTGTKVLSGNDLCAADVAKFLAAENLGINTHKKIPLKSLQMPSDKSQLLDCNLYNLTKIASTLRPIDNELTLFVAFRT